MDTISYSAACSACGKGGMRQQSYHDNHVAILLGAFAAIKSDGRVVTWGQTRSLANIGTHRGSLANFYARRCSLAKL